MTAAVDYWRQLPVWAQPSQTGPGPGLQGPDYSTPRPAQPGENPAGLPQFPGSGEQRSVAAMAEIRAGREHPGQRRRDPYLPLWVPLTYSATPAADVISLGKPASGWRWIVRQLMILPGDTITSGGGAGLTCHFYIGAMPPVGFLPALTDWKWALTTGAAAGSQPPQTKDFTGNQHQVLTNQNLIAFVAGSTPGFTSLIGAFVEQVPDGWVTRVQDV